MHNQTAANGNNTRRQVRLFGVNLAECEVDESLWSEPSTSDGSSTPSHHQQSHEYQGQAGQLHYQYQVHCSNPSAPASSHAKNNHHNNMVRSLFYYLNFNFSMGIIDMTNFPL